MKKLKLNLEDLKVESFQTTPEAEGSEEGTVFGFGEHTGQTYCDAPCFPTICNENTCNGFTCGGTCSNTCLATCSYTCGSTCGSTCSQTCGSTCTCFC